MPKSRFLSAGRFLPRSHFLQRVVLLAGGTALGQGIVIASSPLLTRLYTPEEFGIFGVFTTLIGIFGVAGGLRYEAAIPVCREDGDAAALLLLAGLVSLLTGALTLLTVLLWGEALAAWGQMPALLPLLWLLAPGVTLSGIAQALNYWSIRRGGFKLITLSKLTQPVGQVVPQLGAGLAGGGPAWLALGTLAGILVAIATFLARLGGAELRLVLAARRAAVLAMARRHWRFPTYTTLAGLLNASTRLLPGLLLALLHGPAVAGWFYLAQRAVGAPVQLVSVAVGQVYLSEAPKLAHADGERLYALFMRTTGRLFLVGLAGLALFALPGPWLFGLVFGAEWAEAGRLVQYLSPMLLARFVVYPISQTLNMFDRQDLHLAWDIGNALVLGLSFTLGWSLRLGAGTTVLLYSLGMTASYAFHFWLARRAIRSHLATRPALAGGGSGG